MVSDCRWPWRAMASVFDVTHETVHGIAGLLGVAGLPVAALLLSVSLGRNERGAERSAPFPYARAAIIGSFPRKRE